MTPERVSENGQFRSDWQRKEIGRLRVTYGRTEKQHARAIALLDELYDNDQLDVIRAYRDKVVTMRELLAAKKAGRLRRDDLLVDLRLRKPLWSSLEDAIATRPGGTKHHRRLEASLKKFAASPEGIALGASATVGQLREVNYQTLRQSFDSAADWNHFRKMIGSALSTLLEDVYHPFRRAVMKAAGRKESEPAREVAITPDLFWSIMDAVPEHARPGLVTLAVTGMRLNTEYLRCTAADLRPELPGVYCPGSKTADATGIIPVAEDLWEWIELGIPAPVKENWLRKYFHRACLAVGAARMVDDPKGRTDADGNPVHVYDGLRLHDLRHASAMFALEGGAQLNEAQALMRHADPAMTMRYLKTGERRRAAEGIGKALRRKQG